jgi:hypothetical protein
MNKQLTEYVVALDGEILQPNANNFDRATATQVVIGNYLVFYQFLYSHKLVVDFVAVQITGWSVADSTIPVCYEEDCEDPLLAEVFVEGFVKSDQCSNWTFNDKDCMLHLCDQASVLEVGTLLAAMYDIAKIEIGSKWIED